MKNKFQIKKSNMLIIGILFFSLFAFGCSNNNTKVEIDYSQLSADVPELDALHEYVYVLWHNAYPKKDYNLIRTTFSDLNLSVSRLIQAELPGILKEKQQEWDNGLDDLASTLLTLHNAIEKNDEPAMLKSLESFHSIYEKLVSITKPKLPELESFHQEMYKVYHYYMPNYDLKSMSATIPLMKEKSALLKEAKLPNRYSAQKEQFDSDVLKLEMSLSELESSVKTGNKEKIQTAVETLHSDYQVIESIFE